MTSPGFRSNAILFPMWRFSVYKMAESEEEVDVLVQRVVKDIINAFKRNPNM